MNKDQQEKNISNTPQERLANIIFEKKNTKSRFKLGVKLSLYLMLAVTIGALASNLTIKYKYGQFIEEVEAIESGKDMVILDYIKVTREVSPSLVTISDSEEKLTSDSYFRENITGIIIDSSGVILTNYLAVKDFQNIFVKLSSVATNPIEARILIENEDMNIAIIKIDSEVELQPIKIANTNTIKEGQGIVVLGNAIGDEYVGSVIPGIITSKNEKIEVGENKSHSLLQVNAPINSKNTGGAICNAYGELVGIADWYITEKRNEDGLYYGLQMEELQEMINSTNSLKELLGINEGGIIIDNDRDVKGFYVQQLDKEGSAYRAGIKPTDIIMNIDGYEVVNVEDIINILQEKKKDNIFKCEILRDGKLKEIEIKVIS